MSALDKLRALDDAASPGPWKTNWATRDELPGVLSVCLLDVDTSSYSRNFATARRAALAHMLLPAFEALDKQVKLFNSEAPNDGAVAAGMSYIAEAVLAQLEEALK